MTSIGSFVAFGNNGWIIVIDINEDSEHGGVLGAEGSIRNMGS